MKLERIKAGKSIEVLGGWHRLDIEATVDENDDRDSCYMELKGVVDRWLPNVQHEPTPEIPIIPKTNEEKRQETIRNWVTTINSMVTKPGLENLRPLIEKTKIPELTKAFEKKLKEFK